MSLVRRVENVGHFKQVQAYNLWQFLGEIGLTLPQRIRHLGLMFGVRAQVTKIEDNYTLVIRPNFFFYVCYLVAKFFGHFVEKALMILYIVQLLNRLAFWLVAIFNDIFIFFFTPITTLQFEYNFDEPLSFFGPDGLLYVLEVYKKTDTKYLVEITGQHQLSKDLWINVELKPDGKVILETIKQEGSTDYPASIIMERTDESYILLEDSYSENNVCLQQTHQPLD